MPRLLFHADPSCEDGRFAIPTHVGDCVHVARDDEPLSDLEHKHYLVIETDKPYEECLATFMASGVPDAVQQAFDDAVRAHMAATAALAKAPKPDPKDFLVVSPEQAAVDEAKAALDKARFDPRDYPQRRVKLDLSAIPAERIQAVAEFKAAVDAARPEADLARKAFVAATISDLGLAPTAAAKIFDPDPAKPTAFAGAPTDAIADELRTAARDGWAHVIEPIERSFVAPEPIVLDAKALDALVVVKS